MKFEYPEFFFAFFFLAIPIVIHLFNFRKYKVLYFSSLQFVKQINEETKSTQRLKHLLVLLSRLLAFSALILAFAQPYKPVSKSSKGGYPMLGIYIDNSFSMSMKGSDGELLSMAKEKARNLIEKASADTRIMLVTNNMEGFEQRLVSKENALERLDKIELSPLVRQLDAVIEWMREGASVEREENGKLSSKQYILLSDFQKKSASMDHLKSDSEAFYYPIKLVPQQASNISIDSIWFNDPNFKVGINNELNVRVRNFSELDLVNLELQLEVNQTKRDVFVDLAAKKTEIVKINYSDLKPGIKKGILKINDKQMNFDDDYFFSYEVREKSTILIIDGEQGVSNIALVYSLDPYYQVQSISHTSFTANSLEQKDLVILNGLNKFTSGAIESLVNFLKGGGTLAVFPGENLDAASANSFLKQINGPLFQGLERNNTKIREINYSDPFFSGMFDKKPAKLNLPTQTKAYKFSNRGLNGITRLIEFQNGNPLFLKLSAPYSCYLFGSSLGDSFGSFKSSALFSSVLLRIAEMGQRRYPICLSIGSEAQFPVYNAPNTEEPLVLKTEENEFIPQIRRDNHITSISLQKSSLNSSLKAGLYEIHKSRSLGYMALNYNRAESEIAALEPSEIKNGFATKGIEHLSFSQFSGEADASFIKLEKPQEYWRIFLALALGFLLIEMALLKWMK